MKAGDGIKKFGSQYIMFSENKELARSRSNFYLKTLFKGLMGYIFGK